MRISNKVGKIRFILLLFNWFNACLLVIRYGSVSLLV